MSDTALGESWVRVAEGRRSQLKRRLAYAAVGSIFVAVLVSPLMGAACFALITVSQILDAFVWRPIESGSEQYGEQSWLVLFSVAQSTLVYGAVPAALWTIDDAGVKAFSCLWLSGALLHVTMHLHHHKLVWLCSTLPHLLVFASLPVFSYFLGDLSLGGAIMMLFGIALLMAHMAGTFRIVNRTTTEIDDSRREAVRQREEAQHANEAKSAFLATMSHEIRTPLNGVIALSEALCTDELAEKSAHKAETIRSSGMLLLQLLNDILDVSKIEAGRFELESAPFDLEDTARRLAHLHTPKAREQGIDFDVVIDADVAHGRLGDEHRILQVLHNLVSNAIKFTEVGSVIAAIKNDGRDGWLRFEVRDTGVGMSEKQIQRVLEPFVQADSSVTRRFGGTGLGLSIVRGILDIMGGKLAIRSVEGEGTVATVAVQLPEARAFEKTEEPDAAQNTDDLAGLNVLVVDDNPVNRLVVTSLLAPIGVETAVAASGAAAIASVGEQTFDVILMDIAMPDMGGVEAMNRIRDALGDNAPPVVAASAHALTHEVEGYLAQGFDDYLTKPITRDALCGVLRRVTTPAPAINAGATG